MDALKKFEEHFGDYGKETPGGIGNLGYRALKWIFEGIVIIIMFFPVDTNIFKENINDYFTLAVAALAVVSVLFEIQHYVVQQEEGRAVSIYQKLTYTPVAGKTIRKTLLQRLLRHVGAMTVIAVVIQISMTLSFCPRFVWQNLLYAVCVTGFIPFAAGLLLIYTRR